MGNIDERYIAEARSEFDAVKVNSGPRGRNRFFNWKTLTAAAAVLVLVVTGTALALRIGLGKAMKAADMQAPASVDSGKDQVTLSLYYWYTESGCRFAFMPAEIDDESDAFESGFYEDMAIQNSMDIEEMRELLSDPEKADYLRRNTVSMKSVKGLSGGRKAYTYVESTEAAPDVDKNSVFEAADNEAEEVRGLLGLE